MASNSERTIDLGLSGRTGMDMRAWVKIRDRGVIWDIAGNWHASMEGALQSLVHELADRFADQVVSADRLSDLNAEKTAEIQRLRREVQWLKVVEASMRQSAPQQQFTQTTENYSEVLRQRDELREDRDRVIEENARLTTRMLDAYHLLNTAVHEK